MTLAIHASTDDATIGDDVYKVTADPFVDKAFSKAEWQLHKSGPEYFYGGVIIGLVDVVACVCISELTDDQLIAAIDDPFPWASGSQNAAAKRSDWANGPYCLILDNPRRFKTGVVCRGQLNYWTIPADKLALVNLSMQTLIRDPQELPNAPIGGVAKWLGRRAKVN